MSLGGTPSRAMQRAIRQAIQSDMIVLAAAGNCVGLVVYPARYDEVIAVAGSNVNDGTWPGSCHGQAVDITAPGEKVEGDRRAAGRHQRRRWPGHVVRGCHHRRRGRAVALAPRAADRAGSG